jgi:hypothetical protein
MEVALASSLHSANIAFGAITGGITDATQFFPHFGISRGNYIILMMYTSNDSRKSNNIQVYLLYGYRQRNWRNIKRNWLNGCESPFKTMKIVYRNNDQIISF